jgi:GDPmannose 4,6-dehydratase
VSIFSKSRFGFIRRWEGKEDQEIGKDPATGKIRVRVDPRYYRPTEVEQLLGDPTKANKKLGWKKKVDFDSLVKEMVEADILAVKANSDN